MIVEMKWGVVLLAAGGSGRMGTAKLLLPWAGTSILGHQLDLWQRLSVHQVAVVHANAASPICGELNRLNFPAEHRISNPQPEQGMFSSIRCAALWPGWDGGLTHWVVGLGDQPHLRVDSLQALLKFSAAHPDKVCQPRWRDKLRHPVVLPRQRFQQLSTTRHSTLSEFLKSIPGEVAGCDLDDPGLEFDIDTPEDYERALREFPNPLQSGHNTSAGLSL